VALVDLGLPVMSGFDLAKRIRHDSANRFTRLIALSGYGQDSDVQAAIDAGFDEHLTKPPDPERLERLLIGTDRRAGDRSVSSGGHSRHNTDWFDSRRYPNHPGCDGRGSWL
jgi:CheY-like chemotaxis protein